MNPKETSFKKLVFGNGALAGGLLIILLQFPSITEFYELKTIDSRFRIKDYFEQNPPMHESVVHVNLDNYSKAKSGYDIWPKKMYADLLEKVAESGARAMVVDVMFINSADTVGNGKLVESYLKMGNAVSPYLLQFGDIAEPFSWVRSEDVLDAFFFEMNPSVERGSINHAVTLLTTPMVEIIEQSASTGFANMEPDADGVIRRVPALAEVDGKLVLSFYFQSLCTFLDYDSEQIEVVSRQKVMLHNFPVLGGDGVEEVSLPLDKNGNLIVNLAGGYNKNNYPRSYSAWDVLGSKRKLAELNDKLVIVSDISSTSMNHFSPVPLNKLFPRSYLISNGINTIMTRNFIKVFSGWSSIFLTLILGVIIIYLSHKLRLTQFSMASLIVILSYLLITGLAFVFNGIILPVFSVIIPGIGMVLFTSVNRFSEAERYKGVLEGSLQSYLSPTLMEKIKDDPDILKVGGQTKRISVIFSDIVAFTSFCDKADPAEVQNVLERYFSETAKIIFSNGGYIDKYLGDGILIFFENDGDEVTSAKIAVESAVEMQKMAKKLDTEFKEQNRLPFAIRIGTTTGYAKVGNIGPVERKDYTIVGSVVNLCQRLESFGEAGDIVIDSDTHFFIKDDYETVDFGEQAMKGFEKPVKTYKVKNND